MAANFFRSISTYSRYGIAILLTAILASCQPEQLSSAVRTPTNNESNRQSVASSPATKPSTPPNRESTLSPTLSYTQFPTAVFLPLHTPTIDPLACLPPTDSWTTGIVEDVRSGDTLRLKLSGYTQTIRCLGITAGRPLPPSDFFAPPAATQNARLTRGQVVWFIPDQPDRDRFGTRQGYLVLYDTRLFLNYELVRNGYVQVSPAATPFACQPLLLTAESLAATEQIGRWAPTPSPASTITPLPTTTPSPSSSPTGTGTGTPPTSTPGPSPTATHTPGTLTPQPTHTSSPTTENAYPYPTTPAYPVQ